MVTENANHESTLQEELSFRGGPVASLVPLAVFVLFSVMLLFLGALSERGMILGAMAGIVAGLLLARKPADYCEALFELMANRVVVVAIVCWLWAGMFGGLLRASGLVDGIIWVALQMELSGNLFVVLGFFGACVFAVSVGTGLGTVIGFTSVLYPAGVALGADPAALLGAILSGAAFGDNLAPVSDTTIVSAATQEADVGGVVRSRLKYALPAAAIAAVLFFLVGSAGEGSATTAIQSVDNASAAPLIMLIPAATVFILAVSGQPFLVSLTASIVVAIIVGALSGVLPWDQVVSFTPEGQVTGALIGGAGGMIDLSILTLLLVTNVGIFEKGGGNARLMAWLDRTIVKSVRGAELAIITLIAGLNLGVTVNTVAIITTGPLVNDFRKRHGINRYRAANLLDTISCSFPYALPYGAAMIAAVSIQRSLAGEGAGTPEIPWWGDRRPLLLWPRALCRHDSRRYHRLRQGQHTPPHGLVTPCIRPK
jgi:Na+/H+ antiporter NhaC